MLWKKIELTIFIFFILTGKHYENVKKIKYSWRFYSTKKAFQLHPTSLYIMLIHRLWISCPMLVVVAEMPHYLFPLMDIDLTYKPLECLRLGALGVLAHMLKAVHTHYIVSSFTAYIFVTKRLNIILNISLVLQPIDGAAVRFLMDNGALRYCTKAIEIGSTESKTVSFLRHIYWLLDYILKKKENVTNQCTSFRFLCSYWTRFCQLMRGFSTAASWLIVFSS